MARHMHDAERLLTPPDAEDLLLRVAAEQTVSPLSMDLVYDPPPVMKLRKSAEEPEQSHNVTYATVLVRAMCASDEPSLKPHESMQWSAHMVVRIVARLARAHQTPQVFEPILIGMNDIEVDYESADERNESKSKTPCYPFRFALGWLLLDELQREPRGGGGKGALWAKQLAQRIVKSVALSEKINETYAYSRTLFGEIKVAHDVSAARRNHFGV